MGSFWISIEFTGSVDTEIDENLIRKIYKEFNKRGMTHDEIVEEVYRRLTWKAIPHISDENVQMDDYYIDENNEEEYKDEIRKILYGK